MKKYRLWETCLAGCLSLLLMSSVRAWQPAPPAKPVRSAAPAPANGSLGATILLQYALGEMYGGSKIPVLADSTVAFERIPKSVMPPVALAAEAEIEKELDVLVKSLPAGTIWGKLYLPAAPPGRTWKGDDIAAFAFAQARLFGSVGVPTKDGSIEILGKRVSKDAAPAYVAGLGLTPVYVLTNTKRRLSISSWSAASEEEWSAMSKDERRQYGSDQAAQIMALSPEERAQVLEQMRQHDKFFDSVKDPLEKLIGHDL